MAIDDITKKAQAFLKDNKVQDALKSEKAEEISDKLLDSVANAAKKVSGGKHDAKIDEAKAKADKHIGNE
ncbi:Rv0909 family putative TA system antitoxin [Herbiconiux sp. CPCC 203407]|uniref:Rv0909 family putative TA system antitoxin n=1 Tax=Herbiconiux oxytropis TaxID=2970915 RepID=A0AA41XFQ3_9MICO|nr:Rv0909 family putative TA system antitoxin [Herbiconiux oxytropis]MCS5724010.1 Rv0909 family putative TA system antitoxin [Herbiconiux oxytropis]MCS5727172.1 Rv0909 family putative TA system antitoxin [Herbiconiux oxytropis]